MMIGQHMLLTPLEQGGMAEIWLARQTGLKGFERLVVIKRMIDALASDAEHVDMFLTEARLAAQLSHPHVVQYSDLGEQGNSLYIVMEYLDGENVSVVRRMAAKHGLPLLDHYAVRLIAWAADGLHYAHTRVGVDGKPLRIVHRDISPQNLFVTFDGGLKVLDFGVAKIATHQTHSGKLKGKLGYMSPEQARGEPLDARSDVFSLGVVLFELITHGRLLPKLNDLDTLTLMASGELPKPSERRGDIPPGLEAIILKAMAVNRDERYQSAREFLDALEAWLTASGKSVTTGDLADFLRTLFVRRIHDRRQLIEAAMRAEMTPNSARSFDRLAKEQSPSETTSSRRSTHLRQKRPVALIAGMVAVIAVLAVVLVALLSPDSPSVPAATVAPPPPPPPRPPVLVVDTVPTGGALSVDGKPAGNAPLTLETLTAGEHQLSATREGHEPASRTVKLTAGEKVVVELALVPTLPPPAAAARPEPSKPEPPAKSVAKAPKPRAAGKLTLKTTPWTTVYLGKQKLGDTPLLNVAVPAGKQVLRLVNPESGLESSIEVDIVAGETTVKKLRL